MIVDTVDRIMNTLPPKMLCPNSQKWDYVTLHGKKKKRLWRCDEIKALVWKDSELFGWAQCNHRGP